MERHILRWMPLTLGGLPLSVLVSFCVKITPCPRGETQRRPAWPAGCCYGVSVRNIWWSVASIFVLVARADLLFMYNMPTDCVFLFSVALSCIVLHLTICMIWRWGVADSTQPQDKQTPNLAGVPLRTPTRLISVRSWTLKPKLSFCRRIKLPPWYLQPAKNVSLSYHLLILKPPSPSISLIISQESILWGCLSFSLQEEDWGWII